MMWLFPPPLQKLPGYRQQLDRKWLAVLKAAACNPEVTSLVVPDAGCGHMDQWVHVAALQSLHPPPSRMEANGTKVIATNLAFLLLGTRSY